MFSASAGRFLTTEPPGKPHVSIVYSFLWLSHVFHLLPDGHVLLCFVFVSQSLAIRDKIAMSYMYTSLCGCLFSILIPTCVPGLHDSPDMFNFLRND